MCQPNKQVIAMGEQDLNLYWKTVVDTIQDGVMIVDTEGTIVSVNRGFEEITGYGADDILRGFRLQFL
jgi:PAS domain S-box-containing protein